VTVARRSDPGTAPRLQELLPAERLTVGLTVIKEIVAEHGGEQFDARRIENSHFVLAREEGDADVVERGAADDPVRTKLVLADPAPQREALVRSIPERARPRVVLDVQTARCGKRVGDPSVVETSRFTRFYEPGTPVEGASLRAEDGASSAQRRPPPGMRPSPEQRSHVSGTYNRKRLSGCMGRGNSGRLRLLRVRSHGPASTHVCTEP